MDKRYRKDDEWIDWAECLKPMKGRSFCDIYAAMSPYRALDELEALALRSGVCTQKEADILVDKILNNLRPDSL